ncbi:MAG: hypothetical protein RR825_06905, partial [Ruthenibacterium sp.]
LLARLGARSVLSFRLCWYVLLSLCYVALYLRYAKWYGRVPLLLWPVFYLCSITTVPLCTSILAEQLQAVGMVMLLLEFLHYTKTHEVSRASAVCIALAINLSFLSAFVAAFACAGIVLGYILCEVSLCARAPQRRRVGAILMEKIPPYNCSDACADAAACIVVCDKRHVERFLVQGRHV